MIPAVRVNHSDAPGERRFRGTAPAILALAAAITIQTSCNDAAPEVPAPDASSRRSLAAGEVVGFRGGYGSHVWLGIPFAKPPLGERRWRAPEPVEPWEGALQATRFASPCPQFGSRFGGVSEVPTGTALGDEDCLYLNVYAPAFAVDGVPAGEQRLPVMVWIHGGGNVVGHGGLYDGGNLAATQDVVVVALNYRLGPLGWFRHASLRADDATPEERSGNFGTLDLIHALEWVRDNIAAFGGDPGRVTIFGESAGGRDVFTLLVSPPAEGLFHRAISQSGRATTTLEPWRGENPVDAPVQPGLANSSAEILMRLLVADGVARDRAAAKQKLAGMTPGEIAVYLRGKHAYELLAAYQTEKTEGLIDVPELFAEGVVLASEPVLERLADPAGYHRIPAIFGTNRDENKVFMFVQPRHVQKLLWVYPRLREPDLYDATSEAVSGAWKVVGADAPAAAIASHGASPAFVYRWDWDEEASFLGADLARLLGASHAFEVPFVFGHFELGEANVVFDDENQPGRVALAEQMMSYWAQFAYTGDPGRGRTGDLPEWRAWDASPAGEPGFMVLDTATDGGSRMSSDVLTHATVVARVREDPRLESPGDRCSVLHDLTQWALRRTGPTEAERYDALAARVCEEFPSARLARGE
jgi:para-nitrobenzyl esterase